MKLRRPNTAPHVREMALHWAPGLVASGYHQPWGTRKCPTFSYWAAPRAPRSLRHKRFPVHHSPSVRSSCLASSGCIKIRARDTGLFVLAMLRCPVRKRIFPHTIEYQVGGTLLTLPAGRKYGKDQNQIPEHRGGQLDLPVSQSPSSDTCGILLRDSMKPCASKSASCGQNATTVVGLVVGRPGEPSSKPNAPRGSRRTGSCYWLLRGVCFL